MKHIRGLSISMVDLLTVEEDIFLKFKSYFKKMSFKNKHKTWWKSKDQFILVFDFQKSKWTDEYYVNVGLVFQDDLKVPKTSKADIMWRLQRQGVDRHRDQFNIASDSDNIISILQKEVFDIFDSLNTLEQVKNKILENRDKYIITAKGKATLELD